MSSEIKLALESYSLNKMDAFGQLDRSAAEDYTGFIKELVGHLSDSSDPVDVRISAAKEIRRSLTSPCRTIQKKKWFSIKAGEKENIRNEIISVICGRLLPIVYVWDTISRRTAYKLPGNNGSVNDIDFHPKEPLISSRSSNTKLYFLCIDA